MCRNKEVFMLKYLPALLAAILWGISYSLIEKTNHIIDKKIFLLLYSFLSLIVYLSLNFSSGFSFPKLDVQNYIYFIVSVITMVLGTFLSLKAIESSNATASAIIESSYPLWCMIIMTFVFNQYTINIKSLLGMALVFIGTLIFLIFEKSH